MEEEFYASIKFKNGEEVFSKVSVCDEQSLFLILLHPITIVEIKERNNVVGFKVEPWLKTASDDTFIISMEDIITVSESDNKDMIMTYKSYVRQVSKSIGNKFKIDRKMGYIGSIDDAKEMLEKLFKDN
jgi:hypothetical protein